MKTPWWVEFTDGTAGCCEGGTVVAARNRAACITGKTVASLEVLPYPASPVIWQHEDEYGKCPPFCYTPNECKGRRSCPKPRSCDD